MKDQPGHFEESPKFELVFQKLEEAKAVSNLGQAILEIRDATDEVRRLADAILNSLEPPPKLYTTT